MPSLYASSAIPRVRTFVSRTRFADVVKSTLLSGPFENFIVRDEDRIWKTRQRSCDSVRPHDALRHGIEASQGRDEVPSVQYWLGATEKLFVFETGDMPVPVELANRPAAREASR